LSIDKKVLFQAEPKYFFLGLKMTWILQKSRVFPLRLNSVCQIQYKTKFQSNHNFTQTLLLYFFWKIPELIVSSSIYSIFHTLNSCSFISQKSVSSRFKLFLRFWEKKFWNFNHKHSLKTETFKKIFWLHVEYRFLFIIKAWGSFFVSSVKKNWIEYFKFIPKFSTGTSKKKLRFLKKL